MPAINGYKEMMSYDMGWGYLFLIKIISTLNFRFSNFNGYKSSKLSCKNNNSPSKNLPMINPDHFTYTSPIK